MELGERNANIKILLKKNSLCGFTVPLFQVFKKLAKTHFCKIHAKVRESPQDRRSDQNDDDDDLLFTCSTLEQTHCAFVEYNSM